MKCPKKNTSEIQMSDTKINNQSSHHYTYISLFLFDKECYSSWLFSKISCLIITKLLQQIVWRHESWIKRTAKTSYRTYTPLRTKNLHLHLPSLQNETTNGNQHYSRELLMMGVIVPETFWAYKKYNKIISSIYLFPVLQLSQWCTVQHT